MFTTLAIVMTLFTSDTAPIACPNVPSDHTVGIELTLPNGAQIDFYASPRTFEMMTSEGIAVTLPYGCTEYLPDFGEDGERTEIYDEFSGWEVDATVEGKQALVSLGYAFQPGSEARNGRELANVSWTDREVCK